MYPGICHTGKTPAHADSAATPFSTLAVRFQHSAITPLQQHLCVVLIKPGITSIASCLSRQASTYANPFHLQIKTYFY
jgi:hypothetical protein